MTSTSNYDRYPVIRIESEEQCCLQGWAEILAWVERKTVARTTCKVAMEGYPGVFLDDLAAVLKARFPEAAILRTASAYKSSEELNTQFAGKLTEDSVFGRMHAWTIADYFDVALMQQQRRLFAQARGLCFLIGTGAAFVAQQPHLLMHAGVARWELQQRQRAHRVGNLGLNNPDDSAGCLYKNAFFIDWRVADRIRHEIYKDVDCFLDLNDQNEPRMLEGEILRGAVSLAVQRPFRVVPFFDPGPWGGDWMQRRFGLPDGLPNYAWGFDCVPEENSVMLGFGRRNFELPANVLVHEEPEALLGNRVYRRFGAEFPIRFDLLDTMNGGNLSLQVHPLAEYIREHFGMDYTQDESYYILDCGNDSRLYLGLREGLDPDAMRRELETAQKCDTAFDAERFVATWPSRKHDHFSIPAGTVHCSGKNNVVLEISATPYIFTFKLWDWGRVGLDGNRRPIHLAHGFQNIQWNRTAEWARRELIDQVETVDRGEGWREERTGLHASEFLETRRHWFTGPVPHDTKGNLNVLNLVEGEEAVVESPTDAFRPMKVHYAETLIVPACVGKYTIRPFNSDGRPLATIKAYVRD